ncbi:MAG: translocation/assembly module TamB domain-containing protein [Cocleimonas sp.]
MSLLLVILFLMVVLLFTPFGPKIIASVVDNSIEDISIKGVSGSIFTGLKVEEFSLDSNVGIVLKDIKVNVDQYDIENKKIFADKVVVGELAIVLKAPDDNDEEIEIPNFGLPINIDANQLQLDSLKIIRKIPDSDDTQTLLFQIEGMVLKQATIKDGQLHFEKLEGKPTILDQPLKINVSNGSLNMNQPHEISTSGNVSFTHPELGNLTGEIQVGGTLTQYIVESNLVFEQDKIGTGSLKVKGEGDYKKVVFNDVEIISNHGNAKATGDIIWDPEILLNFDIEGKQLTTETLLPEWPVIADATVKYNSSYIDSRLENNIDIVSLEGVFRDQKLTVKGQITDRQGLIIAKDLDFKLGDNALSATGAVTEPLSLDLIIDAENLTQLLPELTGKIQGLASIKGQYKTPKIISKLSANNLSYGNITQGKKTLFVNTDVGLQEDGSLQIKNIIATLGKNELKLSGKASEPYDLTWDVNAKNIKQITPLISGRIKGTGVLSGTVKELKSTLKLNANSLEFDDFKQGKETLSVEGELGLNEKVIQLESLLVKSGKNSINVSGQASEPVDLNLKINAKNLSEVSPDISGRVSGTATVKGDYASPIITTNLLGSKLSFKKTSLANADLKLQGEVEIRDGVPIVKQLNSQIGNNTIQITGKASSPFDLTWNIDSKNLQQILPELSGSLLVKGKLQGTIDKPIINATGDAKNLKYRDYGLQSGVFSASTNNDIYRIKGDLTNLQNVDQKVRSAKVELNGRIEYHVITAVVDHSDAKVNLNANGGWQNQRWNGTLKTLNFADTQAGDWKLQKPVKISLSQDGFSADKMCISSEKTQACSTASYTKASGLTAKGILQKTPLKLLKPFLPEGIILNGDIEGSYDIKQNNGRPTGVIKFKLPKSSFSIIYEDDEEKSFSYEEAEITANINNRTINVETKAKFIGRGAFASKANILGGGLFSSKATIKLSPENGKHTIDGVANFDIPNINFVQSFVPRTRGLRGVLNSQLTFTGLLAKPQIKGQAKLTDGYVRLPEAGTEITNMNLNVIANKPGQATVSGKMLMGKGVLNVSGDVNLKDITKWKANVKIKGNNIRFMNTNEVRAIMSPDITINLTPELVGITGKIDIPEADIRLKAIPETSIDESTDTFVIGETAPGEKVTSVKIRPKVLISLGKKVRMDAFGLEAKLSGDVNITHNRRDILANGSLRVQDGKFQAYGQDLAINNGRLIFNGSPRLIGMDIRATRTIDKQIVGIHLGGTLLKPKSTLFADPTLDEESEILSYLITGNTLSSASGQESALLLSAARGLGVTGSGSIVQKIGSSFGLDDVNIVTKDDLKKSEIALGKRLGSRLYVRYLIGLFDQTQKIAIEYKINDVLSLEAQTTPDDFGLDFIYEIERD